MLPYGDHVTKRDNAVLVHNVMHMIYVGKVLKKEREGGGISPHNCNRIVVVNNNGANIVTAVECCHPLLCNNIDKYSDHKTSVFYV